MKSKINILIAVLALALASCLKNEIVYDTDNLEFRTWEFAMPIAKIHAPLYESMKKWIDFEGDFLIDKGIICVRYTHSEKVKWGDEEIGIKDIRSLPDWNCDVPPFSSDGQFTGDMYQTVPITTIEIDSYITEAHLASCNLNLRISVPGSLKSDFTLTIPQLIDAEDNVFTKPYSVIGQDILIIERLENYRIDAPDKEMELTCDFTITNTGGSSPGGLFKIDLALTDIVADYMKGYFGQTTADVTVEMEFDFFDELDFDGTVGIQDIGFEATVINWTGIPLQIEAKEINFIKEDMNREKLADPFILDVPSATLGNNYTVESSSALTPSQKLSEILFEKGKYPTAIEFVYSGTSNPNPNLNKVDGENFIVKTVDHLAEAQITLTVPLHVKVENYSRTDNVDFDYNDIVGNDKDKVNNVEYVHINLVVDNGLPFEVVLEAFAINESGSFNETNSSSIILPKEKIGSKKKTDIAIRLLKAQLDEFRENEVKNIVLYSSAQTENESYVKVSENDYLDIAVSVSVKAEIPSNL